MTILSSLNFSFDNVTSKEMGVINVNLNGGMLEEIFSPNRNAISEKIRGRDKPYFMGFEYDVLSFELNFAIEDTFDSVSLRKIAKWLTPGYYAPLIFDERPTHIYYVLCTNGSKLVHNAINQGYVSVKFECNAPWAYTPVYETQWFDLTSNTSSGTAYTIDNIGDMPTKPIIETYIVSGDGFKVVNGSNSGEEIELTDLATGETVMIDCEYKIVSSDVELVYRYNNMTTDSKFITFVEGKNHLIIYGNVKIRFKYQSPLLV